MPKERLFHQIFILFTSVIALTQAVGMLVMQHLDLSKIDYWLLVLLDASSMSLISVFTLSILLHIHRRTDNLAGHSIHLKVAIIVFAIEMLIMLLLPLLPASIGEWPKVIIDALFLSILSSSIIYWTVFLPELKKSPYSIVSLNTRGPNFWSGIYPYITLLGFLCVSYFFLYHDREERLHNEIIQNETVKLKLLENLFFDEIHQAVVESQILSSKPALSQLDFAYYSIADAVNTDYLPVINIQQHFDQLRFIFNAIYSAKFMAKDETIYV